MQGKKPRRKVDNISGPPLPYSAYSPFMPGIGQSEGSVELGKFVFKEPSSLPRAQRTPRRRGPGIAAKRKKTNPPQNQWSGDWFLSFFLKRR